MALPVMVAIVATGLIVANRMVDTSYASLVATRYGWLLNAKLALLAVILSIAARAHLAWLPAFAQNSELAHAAGRGLRMWLTVEFVLASVLLVVATVLANAVPAKHAVIEHWPYPFRFSVAATWGDPSVMVRVWAGTVLLVWAGGHRARLGGAMEGRAAPHRNSGRAGGLCAGRGLAFPCR
jgi:putative copper resistance protein D